MKRKAERILYDIMLVAAFAGTFFYEILTPIYSDDMSYMQVVAKAQGIGDLFRQEAEQYLGWTGRSVAHLMMRFQMFFFGLNRGVFNVVAAAVSLCLFLLMMRLVHKEEKRDPRLFALIVCVFWLYGVKLGQTVFWMTGAFNYLFTTTIILGFFALCYRWFGIEQADGGVDGTGRTVGGLSGGAGRAGERLKQADGGSAVETGRSGETGRAGVAAKGAQGDRMVWLRAACLVLVGILAGWCNENSSGGAVLFALILVLYPLWEKKQAGKSCGTMSLRIAALIGVSLGFLMQLLSPGNRSRTALIAERHEGLMLYVARFLKILASVESLFLPLLLAALFLLLLARRQGMAWFHPKMRNALLFLLLFFATCGCLILAPDPQTRVYFAPGIFLIIACAQLYEAVIWEGKAAGETVLTEADGAVLTEVDRTVLAKAGGSREGALLAALRDFVVFALLVVLAFRYCAEAGNLARIYREEQNRYALLEAGRGYDTVYAPLLPEQFDSPYSMAYEVDLETEWTAFPNMQMGGFYDIPVLVGVPFDAYDEYAEDPFRDE